MPRLMMTWQQQIAKLLDCRSAIRTRKINLPANQKSYDNSETTVGKLSARRNQICRIYFSVIIFDLLLFKTSENMAPTKIDPAGLDSPRRILSNSDVSGSSKVPRINDKLIF